MRFLWPSSKKLGTGGQTATCFAIRMFSTILLALAFASAATAQNPVIDWDAIAVTTVTSGNPIPPPGSNFGGGAGIYLAYAHLAMYNAVNAIDHRFQSYGPDIPAPAGASPEVAAIAAAYTTLKFYFQDQAVVLGNQYAASLAVIPDGATKNQWRPGRGGCGQCYYHRTRWPLLP